MLAAQRKEQLKEELLKNKSIIVKDIAQMLEVTEETIRRDLKKLEAEGIVQKTHGGAILKSNVLSPFTSSDHKKLLLDCKIAMAQIASKYVTNKMCIFLDSSTTVFEILPLIENLNVTIVSNSLDVMVFCAGRNNIHLIALGGDYDAQYGIFHGSDTCEQLNNLFFDIAFLSSRTASLQSGFCESNRDLANIKRLVSSHTNRLVTVIDSTKINKMSFIKSMDISKTHVLITDLPLNDDWKTYLKENNIDFRIATEELCEYKYLKNMADPTAE